MYDLVVDMERYPEFVPLCKTMRVRGLTDLGDGVQTAISSMTVAYKMFHEVFTTKVTMNRPELWVAVDYLDGPLKVLANRWTFRPLTDTASEVEFMIDYEFKSRMLAALMGAVFERAFRKFATAFENRADQVYGNKSRLIAAK